MAHSCGIESHRVALDPQAAHCDAFEEILSRYVDHYYLAKQTFHIDEEDPSVDHFITLASETYGASKEFVCSVNMDLDVDWEDCLNVGHASVAWAFDPVAGLVLLALAASDTQAGEMLAQRFLNPW